MPALIAQYGLIVVALIIFCGEIGLPTIIPGEVALLIAGSRVDHSVPALVAAVVVFGSVDVLATSTIHILARTGGNRALLCVMHRLKPGAEQRHEEVLQRWRRRLGGRDGVVVFVTRLIPMFRLYASITTGLVRIRLRHFFRGAVPAAYVWAATPLTIGFIFRGRIQDLESHFGLMMRGLIIGSIVVTVTVGVVFGVRRGKLSRVLGRVKLPLAAIFTGALAVLPLNDEGYLQSVFPALSTLPVQSAALSVLVIGFLWVGSRGFHAVPLLRPSGRFIALSTTARMVLVVTAAAFMTSGIIRPAGHLASGTAATSCGASFHFQGGSVHASALALRQAHLQTALCRSWPQAPRS